MKCIVGLGNPGGEYNLTKHNIGFRIVKSLAREYGIGLDEKKHSSVIGRGRIEGEEVVLILPQTFMNLSGKAIGEIRKEEIKSIEDLIVICDDINLKLGKIRLRKKGSSGGHKGLKSIIDELGMNDFARLRIGIATDIHRGDITNYVLTPFKRKDHKHLLHVESLAKEAVICWVKRGIDETMTKFNTRKVGTS